jgi:hypothetical protein
VRIARHEHRLAGGGSYGKGVHHLSQRPAADRALDMLPRMTGATFRTELTLPRQTASPPDRRHHEGASPS